MPRAGNASKVNRPWLVRNHRIRLACLRVLSLSLPPHISQAAVPRQTRAEDTSENRETITEYRKHLPRMNVQTAHATYCTVLAELPQSMMGMLKVSHFATLPTTPRSVKFVRRCTCMAPRLLYCSFRRPAL